MTSLKSSLKGWTRALVLLALGWAAGCETSGKPAAPSPRPPATDPCAERLHEVSGQLLLYYATNKRLPRSLDELAKAELRSSGPPLVCPESGKAYLYRPDGLAIPDHPGLLVLNDATAVHNGGRWGIFRSTSDSGTSLGFRVMWIDEATMGSVPRATTPSPASTEPPEKGAGQPGE